MSSAQRLALPLAVVLAGCGTDDRKPSVATDADASTAPDATDAVIAGSRGLRIFELRQAVTGDGAPVASNNYFCTRCEADATAAEAFDAATFPDGWAVAPRRTIEAAGAVLYDALNTRGAPRTVDLIESLPGEEMRLGAQPLTGTFVDGPAVLVTMESSRRLSWNAGDTVQELHGDGQTYVLFAQVRGDGVAPPESIVLPAGWTHETRTLDAPFVLEAVPRVVVYMNVANQHLWQRVVPPE